MSDISATVQPQAEGAAHGAQDIVAEVRASYLRVEKELEALRGQTMQYLHLDPASGKIQVLNKTKLDALNAEIDAAEQKLGRIMEISDEIQGAFDKFGRSCMEGPSGLLEQAKMVYGEVLGIPGEAWNDFKILRNSNRTSWFASDLVKIDSYREKEDALRAKHEEAKRQEAELKPLLNKIAQMIDECRRM